MLANFILLLVIVVATGLAYHLSKRAEQAGYAPPHIPKRIAVAGLLVSLVIGSWFPSAGWAFVVLMILLGLELGIVAFLQARRQSGFHHD